ncbi:uncharacterized protein BT62DRAFT_621402 [Guyanagaster necrorhizus]|uniref:Uncharacterized protein n=1 Tax=Guyanagaster necrorhizus TaxID=856835 RepID=A0A9P8AWC8_9AGAR|nr:uncharacterized protein BT62DRAFT_621402 [Guyanagaster necrorhizus MCA 3950]KAG7450051.1 hypothetical protein BT62DRAFT_621402 [Guyanagaster necrorhizus MCA 3950]
MHSPHEPSSSYTTKSTKPTCTTMLAPIGGVILLSCLALRRHRHVTSELEENYKLLSVLRSALAQKDAEVLSLRKALSETTQQASKAATSSSWKDETEGQALKRRISDLNKELDEFRAHNRALILDIQTGKEELHGLGMKLQESEKLSRARAEELRVAQVYLSTADQFSGVEIIQAVEALNEEISGMAATLADVYDQVERGVGNPATDVAYGRVVEILGDTMTSFVKSNSQYEVLQVAFSAAICAHAGWMATSWCLGGDPSDEKGWNEIYDRIRQSGRTFPSGVT